MVGSHLICDLSFPDPKLLVHEGNFLPQMLDACVDAKVQILNTFYHNFGENQGYTFVIALAESHISCHTWPEKNLACLDMFTCGKVSPELVFHLFKENLSADFIRNNHTLFYRGMTDNEVISDDNSTANNIPIFTGISP